MELCYAMDLCYAIKLCHAVELVINKQIINVSLFTYKFYAQNKINAHYTSPMIF